MKFILQYCFQQMGFCEAPQSLHGAGEAGTDGGGDGSPETEQRTEKGHAAQLVSVKCILDAESPLQIDIR